MLDPDNEAGCPPRVESLPDNGVRKEERKSAACSLTLMRRFRHAKHPGEGLPVLTIVSTGPVSSESVKRPGAGRGSACRLSSYA